MMRRTRSRKVPGDAGFTLVELLVALAIVALLLALAAPWLARTRDALSLRTSAYELATHLRTARAAAQRTNVEHVLTVDVAARAYWVDGIVARRPLPGRVEMSVPEHERLGATAARVRFFPDGSASGGRIVLGDSARTADVSVDWLSGNVRLQMRP